jgi:hypothetical protein
MSNKKGCKPKKKAPTEVAKKKPAAAEESLETVPAIITQLSSITNNSEPLIEEGARSKQACKPAVSKEVVPLTDCLESAKRKSRKENTLYVLSYILNISSHSPSQDRKEKEGLTRLSYTTSKYK